ncbi:MAG: FAD-dependent oxidoreductase, partial [Holophagae bacterium]
IEPDRAAFDADLGYDDGLALLDRLRRAADAHRLDFGVKVCNTLPVVNRRPTLAAGGPVAYLSGRPLHAVAVALARRLSDDTGSRLPISFAGGADAFNTPDLLAGGLRPVTVCSDLLRLGGYLRLHQYLDEIGAALDTAGATDLDDLARRRAGGDRTPAEAARVNLARYAERLRADAEVAAHSYSRGATTTGRDLGLFDCVDAPCTEVCSIGQQVPEYMRRVAAGDLEHAVDVIARDNPLPSILGRACHHPCESVCTRTHLDAPLAIRDIKRFVADSARPDLGAGRSLDETAAVAIVGAGPCGLAAAVELARAGLRATIFEGRARSGGMVSATIPGYRAAPDAVERDLDAIATLGITIEYGVEIGRDLALSELTDRGYRAVVLAAGARLGRRLGLAGEDAANVVDGLELLTSVGRGERPDVGPRVAVVGGGDVAIDCARTARRLGGGSVEILYRRTIDQMPARAEELRELLAEDVTIRELVAPQRIVTDRGRLVGLECAAMRLGPPDASGRPRPVEVAGETMHVELDTLIVAVGQRPDLSFAGDLDLTLAPSGYLDVDPDTLETSVPGIYAGGDLRHPGPSSIVDACGDGRRIARVILERASRPVPERARMATAAPDRTDLLARRSHRAPRVATPQRPAGDGGRFAEVNLTLDADAARAEASRCLDCDLMCASCESVCPNRAIVSYLASPARLDPGPDGPAFEVGQAPQVAVLADLCNECGNCATFCPTVGRPWRDKPRLYLHRPDFEAESDNAFMLLEISGRPAVQGRFDGVTHQLTAEPEIELRSPTSRMRLDPDTLEIRRAAGSPASRYAAAVMWTLLRGITGSLPHFPLVDARPEWLVD